MNVLYTYKKDIYLQENWTEDKQTFPEGKLQWPSQQPLSPWDIQYFSQEVQFWKVTVLSQVKAVMCVIMLSPSSRNIPGHLQWTSHMLLSTFAVDTRYQCIWWWILLFNPPVSAPAVWIANFLPYYILLAKGVWKEELQHKINVS